MDAGHRHHIKSYLTAALGLALALSLIVFPEDTYQASREGLKLWFEVLLPALLPFFVTAELLVRFGVVQLIGAVLQPVMYPLFRIPGAGAFALALGLASGYPLGAKITADLRRSNVISRIEAERLVCFANTAGPLFLAGAVAVGMLGLPETALTLMLAHYASTLMVGFIMRFYGSTEPERIFSAKKPSDKIDALFHARADLSQFGTIFYESVIKSFKSLVFIGGCITVFSVLSRMLSLAGIIPALARLAASVLSYAGVNADLAGAAISGILEIDIGIHAISKAKATLMQQLVAISAVIGWSGLSVHAQVTAMLQGTDIRLKPYIIARIIHAICAGAAAAILYRPASYIWERLGITVPALANLGLTFPSMPVILALSSTAAGLAVVLCLLLAFITNLASRVVIVRFRR